MIRSNLSSVAISDDSRSMFTNNRFAAAWVLSSSVVFALECCSATSLPWVADRPPG